MRQHEQQQAAAPLPRMDRLLAAAVTQQQPQLMLQQARQQAQGLLQQMGQQQELGADGEAGWEGNMQQQQALLGGKKAKGERQAISALGLACSACVHGDVCVCLCVCVDVTVRWSWWG